MPTSIRLAPWREKLAEQLRRRVPLSPGAVRAALGELQRLERLLHVRNGLVARLRAELAELRAAAPLGEAAMATLDPRALVPRIRRTPDGMEVRIPIEDKDGDCTKEVVAFMSEGGDTTTVQLRPLSFKDWVRTAPTKG